MTSVQVLVPWRDSGCPHRRAAWRWCQARWRKLHPDWPVVTGTCGDGPWSVAAALNDALANATSEVVLIVGADTALTPQVARAAVEQAELAPWVLATDDLLRVPQDETRLLMMRRPGCVLPAGMPGERQRGHLGWGPLAGLADALRRVGWDERFVGWGGEDEAFAIAARIMLGEPWRGDGSAYQLWHPVPDRDPDQWAANISLLGRYHEALEHPALFAGVAPAGPPCGFRRPQGRCCLPAGHLTAHLVG